MTGLDLNRLRGLGRILAVKESVWDLPFADACFGLDVPWMERRQSELSQLAIPLYLAVPPKRPFPILANATYYTRIFSNRLSDNPAEISCGRNSGFGALGLAKHKHARQIVLFGFDYRPNSYYCPERYTHKKPETGDHWPSWAKIIDGIADQLAGIEVINASPNSTIRAFKKIGTEEAIQRLRNNC